MKILHFLPAWEPAWQFGGPIRSTLELCKGIQAQGADVRVITTTVGVSNQRNIHITLGQETNRSGIPVTYFSGCINAFSAISSNTLLEAAAEYLAWSDLFHISAIWHPIGLQLQKMAIRNGVPFIHSLRGALSEYSFSQKYLKKFPYYFFLERPLLSQASALHVTSRSEYDESRRPFLRLPESLQRLVIPNISDIKVSTITPSAHQEFLTTNCMSSEAPTLLICGRIDHKKGLNLIPNVLRAIESLPWNLLIVGSDYDSSLTALLSSLNQIHNGHNIRYLGLVEPSQLPLIYSVSDLLLMPSYHENFGNVALEALSHGCQVLVSNNVGIVDHLECINHVNSWGAVLPRDELAWSYWLEVWLSSKLYMNRFVMSDHFKTYFSSDHISRLWCDAYSKLL